MFSDTIITKTQKQFEKLCLEFPRTGQSILRVLEGSSADEALILKYLYCNMPLSDIADYSAGMYLQFARHAAFLREHPPVKSSEQIPDEIFLDYVAYHRVNTEGMTACRQLFYEQIKQRIWDKEVQEAVLAINYWCAEEVTYQSTDDRTLSAEAVWRGAIGRCGEESVFTVNVLRSAGIPARQVYAHRWAHCDDNHAWVEVWCEGKWHFLGACEPEEILDRGWFCNAASRSMMVHSRIYGAQHPDGEIINKSGMTSAVNQLRRYADTVRLEIRVEDEKGNPVANAHVSMELLNYAELVPIISGNTDENGKYTVETGKGSLFITAEKDCRETSRVIDTKLHQNICLKLAKENLFYPHENEWKDFDMSAPADAPVNNKKPSALQQETGERKYEEAVEKRKKKTAGFPNEEEGRALQLSRGNHLEIRKFLAASKTDPDMKLNILSVISEKDLRDITAEMLEDHVSGAQKWVGAAEKSTFVKFILNPRIELEQPSAYRNFIENYYSEEERENFRNDPKNIWQWISENISEHPEKEYDEVVTSPCGCLRLRSASERSKRILFVAVCRTLGIPARLHPCDGRLQYFSDGKFREVVTDAKGTVPDSAELQLISSDNTEWIYMQNWSLSVKKEGIGWKTLFVETEDIQNRILLSPGTYRVITTNRLPNGNQFASVTRFILKKGETKQLTLKLRKAELKDMLEKIPLEPFELKKRNGTALVFSAESIKNGPALFIWLDTGKEPTEHILNELLERKKEYSDLQERIWLILRKEEDLKNNTVQKVLSELDDVNIMFDSGSKNTNTIARRMYVDPDKMPLILLIEEGFKGIYAASGYNVGTGDLLLRIITGI